MQNRAAQRNFRERQKEYVHDLERQVDALKMEIAKLHENYQGLLKAVAAPRVSQWAGQLSPASLDGALDYVGSVDGLDSSRKAAKAAVDESLFAVGLNRGGYQGGLSYV